MTEEIIEKLKEDKKIDLIEALRIFKKEGTENFVVLRNKDKLEILNLIQKQQAEIEKKDKIIGLMSYVMTHEEVPQEEYCIWRDMSCEILGGNKECKDCIKQYFEKQLESENK